MKTDDYNDDPLLALIKALEPMNAPVGRLGVLGGHNARDSHSTGRKRKKRKEVTTANFIDKAIGDSTNAEIGAKHELGLDGMPVRSWLRMPIIDKLQEYLEQAGAFKEKSKTMKEVLKLKSIKPWLSKAMIVAERVIADAFATGGFGKWVPSNMKNKTNHQTLVETHQLRDSVTSEVK